MHQLTYVTVVHTYQIKMNINDADLQLSSDNLVYSTSLYEVCIKSVNPGEAGPEISSQF